MCYVKINSDGSIYKHSGFSGLPIFLNFVSGQWTLGPSDGGSPTLYYKIGFSFAPPSSGWTVSASGSSPGPTVQAI